MAASIGRTLDYFISEGARGLPVVTTGLDRKTITYASPAAVALFGYVNGQMIGLPAKELYSVKHERDRLLEELGILEASGSGGETSAHVFLQRKDGTPFLAKVDLFLVKPNGHVEGTAGITQLYGNMNPGLKRELARMQRLTELETRMDLKQHYLEGHAERVGQLCKEISQVMNPDFVKSMYFGGKLHDLGKLFLDDAVLNCNTRIIRQQAAFLQHPELGVQLLRGIDEYKDDETILDCILCHHERWNGSGYPAGLKADQIPLAGRIAAVADSFDAMCSARGYNEVKTTEQALCELRLQSGILFCPATVSALETALYSPHSTRLAHYEALLKLHEKS